MKKLLVVVLLIFVPIGASAQTFEMIKTVVNVENNSILTYFEFNGVQFSISESGKLRYKLPSDVRVEYNNGRVEKFISKNNVTNNIKVYYENNNKIVKISQYYVNVNCIRIYFNANKIERITLPLDQGRSIRFNYNNGLILNSMSKNNSRINFMYSNNVFIKTQGNINDCNVEIVNFSETW